MAYARTLQLPKLISKKSYFLFGPRGTGKTFLIREQLKGKARVINLLEQDLLLRLSAAPWELRAIVASVDRKIPVVIDEVQKIPALLDEVHRLIEEEGRIFLLTGSSARKLRRGSANLLAGRARLAEIFPLTSKEIADFDLERYLRIGGLPFVYGSDDPDEDLDAYVRTYLQEEVQAEGLTRNLPGFARFLKTAALLSGTVLNYTKIGADVELSPSTVRQYVQILEDTLIGFRMSPFRKTVRRKAVSTEKFYLFDLGVAHSIAGIRHLDRNSDIYGKSFEQFIALELRAFCSYHRTKDELSFWRSKHGAEVDFILGDRVAIEVKASKKTHAHDAKGLRALQEEGLPLSYYLISQDPLERLDAGINFICWDKFLERLWGDKL
jgi:predicted AAA+ superfamily ATPase